MKKLREVTSKEFSKRPMMYLALAFKTEADICLSHKGLDFILIELDSAEKAHYAFPRQTYLQVQAIGLRYFGYQTHKHLKMAENGTLIINRKGGAQYILRKLSADEKSEYVIDNSQPPLEIMRAEKQLLLEIKKSYRNMKQNKNSFLRDFVNLLLSGLRIAIQSSIIVLLIFAATLVIGVGTGATSNAIGQHVTQISGFFLSEFKGMFGAVFAIKVIYEVLFSAIDVVRYMCAPSRVIKSSSSNIEAKV